MGDKAYSIITDYLGTPAQAYDAGGEKIWEAEFDIYGKMRTFAGKDKAFIPFRWQGMYFDEETELCYVRHRYYSEDTGTFISQDPIGLAGGNPTLYGYVSDPNSWIDPLGLNHKHHSDPKFMGGNPNQKLTDLPNQTHIDLHKDMNSFLETKTKVVNGEIVSMRPKRGNSGAVIRQNFSRQERLNALAEFYTKNKFKYPDVYNDFFNQHPNLKQKNKPKHKIGKVCR